MNASPAFLSLLNELKALHIAKNAGYAGKDTDDYWANFRGSINFGVDPFLGVLVRLSDKFNRLQNLTQDIENEQVGESMRDTLLDLSSYALVAICLLDEFEYEENKKGEIGHEPRKV